ncbi:RHS repeat-associated core domain-containing protein [Streptomyces chumphonensis]|uniref:RHS repeat-associated core domain-containing protein n=1 Tax=Streptomyces chumphonensis TaxID=1214925 RepID=UPI003D731D54
MPQPYRFAAGYQDANGLYHLSARYYDPHTSRFTQPDPSGQESNPYLYAQGDPTNRIDPTGLYSYDDFVQDIGVIGGLAGTGAGIGGGIGCFVGPIGCGAGAAYGGFYGSLAGIGIVLGYRVF